MKTKITLLILFLFGLIGWSGTVFANPDENDFLTVSGVVRDARNNRGLSNVNVTIPGTGVGTVTNTDGGFSIKIKKTLNARQIEFTHLAYANKQLEIPAADTEGIIVTLTPDVKVLESAIVLFTDPKELVRSAIRKVGENYSPTDDRLTGFYRETIRKRERYITVSEAVLDVYKTSYDQDMGGERIVVEKGRQLLSARAADTVMVKLQGGPYLPAYLDVVKNPELVLNPDELDHYRFYLEQQAMINDRPHYVVRFSPQVTMPYPMMSGILYIDQQTLAFVRVEMSLDMEDVPKATQAILNKKPMGLRFRPEELSHLVTYREQDGRYVLHYVRTRIRFKCDWRRRLFSTNYTVVSETVITDRQTGTTKRPPMRDSFRPNLSLSDEVRHFYDANFWEGYNIIEPTESLENAVDRLKRQYR